MVTNKSERTNRNLLSFRLGYNPPQHFSGSEIDESQSKIWPLLKRRVHLDQAAAGIGKNREFHRPMLRRVHGELDATLIQS